MTVKLALLITGCILLLALLRPGKKVKPRPGDVPEILPAAGQPDRRK